MMVQKEIEESGCSLNSTSQQHDLGSESGDLIQLCIMHVGCCVVANL